MFLCRDAFLQEKSLSLPLKLVHTGSHSLARTQNIVLAVRCVKAQPYRAVHFVFRAAERLERKAFLFGVGSLGGALLQDSGLKHFGLEIVAAFDVDPTLVGTNLNGIPIYHSDDFLKKMEEYDVQIGVLTVPIEIAQCITDMMVDGGIKAVWNFTPFRIRVPEDIVVQNTSLYAHLAVMFNRLNFNEIK